MYKHHESYGGNKGGRMWCGGVAMEKGRSNYRKGANVEAVGGRPPHLLLLVLGVRDATCAICALLSHRLHPRGTAGEI